MKLADQISDVITYTLLVSLFIFFVTISEFALIKSRTIHIEAKEDLDFRYEIFVSEQRELMQSAHSSVITKERRSLKLSQLQIRSAKETKNKVQKMKSKFGFYEVLYENLRLHRPGARFYHLFFVLRRGLFVAGIFLANEHAWLQIHGYVLVCLLQACFLTQILPFNRKLTNLVEITNEILQIWIGYLFLCLIGTTTEVSGAFAMVDDLLLGSVISMVVINSLILLQQFASGVKQSIRGCLRKRKCQKMSK